MENVPARAVEVQRSVLLLELLHRGALRVHGRAELHLREQLLQRRDLLAREGALTAGHTRRGREEARTEN